MKNNNPLICDPQEGVCETKPTSDTTEKKVIEVKDKPVKIIYFTDPICSSCWGIEPQLRKLKLEYGHQVEIEYYMGGLLPDWSYNSGGISKPADVAHHWDEASQYYKMPIDGDVWLEDPLSSSYPPSIAFKAAQLQDKNKAIAFLRILREMLFLQKKNITKWEFIEQAAKRSGLNEVQLKSDYENKAEVLFQEDLNFSRQLGVRGFPTIFITNSEGQSEFVYGFKPYTTFESGIHKVFSSASKNEYSKDWKSLFKTYPTLTWREFAELSEISLSAAQIILNKLTNEKELSKITTKNGDMWIREAK